MRKYNTSNFQSKLVINVIASFRILFVQVTSRNVQLHLFVKACWYWNKKTLIADTGYG